MTLPDYILRRMLPRGIRLPHFPVLKEPLQVAGTCQKCGEDVYWIKVQAGDRHINGRWVQYPGGSTASGYYHLLCPTPDEEEKQAAWEGGYGWKSRRNSKDTDEVPKGNLPQEEYRYWLGAEQTPAESSFAMCRACRQSTYGSAQRIAHFHDPDFEIGGMNCAARLNQVYEKLRAKKICIVCREDRKGNAKWSVPICTKCERAWKFGQTRWLPLAYELNKQKKAIVGILVSEVDGVEKKTTRPYCDACRMFADNEAHADEHRRKIICGEIHAN